MRFTNSLLKMGLDVRLTSRIVATLSEKGSEYSCGMGTANAIPPSIQSFLLSVILG